MPPTTLNCAVLTVSDTRTASNDTSGDLLATYIAESGHQLAARTLLPDDRYQLRAQVSAWIADPQIQVIISTGGTGFTGRDSTPEALLPLFDKTIDGFGELFRQLSYDDIGTSTIQSRAVGGLANSTLIFALPGSSGAVRLGWEKILRNQLDITHRPCNFVELMDRFAEN
ncbi:MAG: molybdenum cofactor biosynthesis protein B [Pseudomonadota bacterium]